LLAIEGALFALSMGAILMRFYVRVFMLKMFGWDGESCGSDAAGNRSLTAPYCRLDDGNLSGKLNNFTFIPSAIILLHVNFDTCLRPRL
jgi:hypothetical protein